MRQTKIRKEVELLFELNFGDYSCFKWKYIDEDEDSCTLQFVYEGYSEYVSLELMLSLDDQDVLHLHTLSENYQDITDPKDLFRELFLVALNEAHYYKCHAE